MTEPLSKAYYDILDPSLLSWDFVSKYVSKEPPFGPIGQIVYTRTYSRFIDQLKRREYWWETCLRVVEATMKLDTKTARASMVMEAERLFDYMFNLKVFTAGRTLWVAGTETSATANLNCSFRTIDDFDSFSEIMFLLMCGTGTGFSVENKYISQLPEVKLSPTKVVFSPYNPLPKPERDKFTYLGDGLTTHIDCFKPHFYKDFQSYIESYIYNFSDEITIYVGDSKEGWTSALAVLFGILIYNATQEKLNKRYVKNLTFNFDNVRPEGERLGKMGGRASGPQALEKTLRKILWIVNSRTVDKRSTRLNSVDCLYISNVIAESIVLGGVRRSAQIAFGDLYDQDFLEAKKDLWYLSKEAEKEAKDIEARLLQLGTNIWDYSNENPEVFYLVRHLDVVYPRYRWRSSAVMSNNSVMLYEKPSKEKLQELFALIQANGEPGLYSAYGGLKRRDDFQGSNPCGEILLRNRGVCNLTEVVMSMFVKPVEQGKKYTYLSTCGNYYFDINDFLQAVELATKAGSRITLVDMFHPEWDKVQKEDRLLGASLTGQCTAWDKLNWSSTDDRAKEILAIAKMHSRYVADQYHDQLGIPHAKLITTVKPSGTLSKLPGVSPGVHKDYGPYYINRVRVSSSDPLAKALRDIGFEPKPENNQGDDLDAPECNTWVFSFPVRTDAHIRAIDEPAIEQLERYKAVMDHYCDHNVSATITFKPEEIEGIVEWLHKDENWESYIGISFLPAFDPVDPNGTCPYPQLPLEPCTKDQYTTMCASMEHFTEEELLAFVTFYESYFEEQSLDSDCASGLCPVR